MTRSRLQPLIQLTVLFGLLTSLYLATARAQEDFTLNFQDADIGTLIATISELTGKNFVIDPRVKGNVTVLSATPMDAEGVYATFLSILQVHGFAAIPSGNVVKIVPEVIAKQEGGVGLSAPGDAPEIVTQVIEIKNVPAAQLVAILRPLVPQYGHLAAYTPSNMLIISDRAPNVKRMLGIVDRIDQDSSSEIEVVKLEHATAAEVARVVTGLIGGAGGNAKRAAESAELSVIADERTNSILIGGDKSDRLRIKTIIAHLDSPVEQDGGTQVVYLRYAKAENLAPILEGYAEEAQQQEGETRDNKGTQRTGSSTGVRILPEPDINALVITAPPKTMRAIRSVIEQLDIRRAQVMVEAIIAEVNISKTQDLGVDWAIFDNDTVAGASLLSIDPATLAQAVANGSAVGLLRSGINIGGAGTESGNDFAILLRALRGDSNTNILSTPSLVTLDNEEAEIKVGQEVPFLTGSFTNTGSTTGSVNPFQTVERKDVGLTLKITPQINEGETVQLKIDQETSSINSSATSSLDLITNKRTLTSSVLIENGDILVLGGLIDDQETDSQQSVPLLGKIPLLGALFRSESKTKDKRNLMLFIRPVILRDSGTANYYTRQKYDFIRNKQLEEFQKGNYFKRKDTPVLPDMNELTRPQRKASTNSERP
ncbi:MAG: type II secretion system secretin GspD [Nevskiales bacterium]